ncbi:MAG: hypothetical protein KKA73_11670 [Chloroflexi bacterium]|nr:hypothetical protein [Chloroflexota bacterium]MBU1748337.1 hypothetical protein [Chloroflexota bacterium]
MNNAFSTKSIVPMLVFAVLLLLLLGLACTTTPDPSPTPPSANPNPTAIPRPSPTSVPTLLPTIAQTPTRPVAWTVYIITDTVTGALVGVTDDARVYQMVEDDYLAAEQWFSTQILALTQSSAPVDLLQQYYTGQRLQEMVGAVALFRDKDQSFRSELIDRRIEVKNFSADGRQVYLGDSWAGGTVWWYSLTTGEIVEEKEVPGGMAIITMLYDDQLGRWRSAAVRTVE